jgi:hypothetical protein
MRKPRESDRRPRARRGDLTLHVVLVGLSRQSTCFVASAALDTVNTPENVATMKDGVSDNGTELTSNAML